MGETRRSSRRSPLHSVTGENKLAFTLLAQRVPLAASAQTDDESEALLFGVAGFLDAPDLGVYPGETRGYVRELWDRWWPHRDEMARLILPETLAARGQPSIESSATPPRRARGPGQCLALVYPVVVREETRGTRTISFSVSHILSGISITRFRPRRLNTMALIGESRIAEIVANVLLPFFLARGFDIWAAYARIDRHA